MHAAFSFLVVKRRLTITDFRSRSYRKHKEYTELHPYAISRIPSQAEKKTRFPILSLQVRKEKEQAEVLADFAGFVAVEKRELAAAKLIQRVLRGHIGRKAAHRWHEKRAEYNATNSLMVAAAVSIQRLLRGSWGRNRAKTIRAGIARWLTHLIDDEAREFEAEILSTNKLEALKRGIEGLMEDDDSEGES